MHYKSPPARRHPRRLHGRAGADGAGADGAARGCGVSDAAFEPPVGRGAEAKREAGRTGGRDQDSMDVLS